MHLKYLIYDLIKAAQNDQVNVIAHGCNCFNTMGSGIAPLIAKAFPEAYEADQRTTKGDKSKLGNLSKALHVRGDGTVMEVFNLYSQYGYWGRNEGKMDLNYEALQSALRNMALLLDPEHSKVGIPKIGAGLAGGDWDVIEQIVYEELIKSGIDTTLYVLDYKEVPTGRTCHSCGQVMELHPGPDGIFYGCNTYGEFNNPDTFCENYHEFYRIKL